MPESQLSTGGNVCGDLWEKNRFLDVVQLQRVFCPQQQNTKAQICMELTLLQHCLADNVKCLKRKNNLNSFVSPLDMIERLKRSSADFNFFIV